MDHRSLTLAATRTLIDHVDELTELDSAIGDGDHGLNMKRGALAIQARLRDGKDAGLAQRDAEGRRRHLHEHDRRLVGAGVRHLADDASPGSCLPRPGRTISPRHWPRRSPRSPAWARPEVGQKTLLDVLDPVQRLPRRQRPGLGRPRRLRVRQCALDSAAATATMDAIRGRASFLGERALGHVDPGSRSMALIIAAICDGLSEARTTP
jgi:dihydroxyacetone kinase-like protein